MENRIFQKAKKYLILTTSIFLLLGAVFWGILVYVFGVFPPTSTQIEEGSMATKASYIVFSDGYNYSARNRETGAIDYCGTNASEIINNAITNSEGVIDLRGTFVLSASIRLVSKTVLQGEGMSTTLTLQSGVNEPLIVLKDNQVHNTIIRDLLIEGNFAGQTSSSSHGIFFNNTDFLNPVSGNTPRHSITNVMIRECRGDGFKGVGHLRELQMQFVNAYDNKGNGFNLAENVTDGKWESCVAGCNNEYGFVVQGGANQFRNCKSFGNDRDGFYVTGWYNIFYSCVAQENDRHGFHLYGTNCYSNQIANCLIDTNNRACSSIGSGVCINSTHVVNRVEGNTIVDTLTPNYQIGIYLLNSNCTIIMNNEVAYNLHQVNITNSYYTRFCHNYGFLTENGGTATGTSPITIPHELAATPTFVLVTPEGSVPCKISYTKDATNIIVYHDAGSSITVSWYAQV